MARKHITKANKDEKGFIHGFIRANADRLSSSCQHFFDRATERHFTFEEVQTAVRGGLVVEVHNDKPGDVRALLRNALGTCVVISLLSFQVITVYYNDPQDAHETLNWNAYRWNQNFVALVKQIRKVN